MADLLKDIKSRIEEDTRPSEQIYAHIKSLGVQMVVTNSLNRETVVAFCAGLIRLYQNLTEK